MKFLGLLQFLKQGDVYKPHKPHWVVPLVSNSHLPSVSTTYPPVNKHSNGKSPSWIGNTSSIRVHFPASYVRLPECKPSTGHFRYNLTTGSRWISVEKPFNLKRSVTSNHPRFRSVPKMEGGRRNPTHRHISCMDTAYCNGKTHPPK